MARPRHQKKEIEGLLQTLEERGWVISKAKKYFKCLCPCGLHKTWVHLTPSNPNYRREKLEWARRLECWDE